MSAVVKCASDNGTQLRLGALGGYPDEPRIFVQALASGVETSLANPTRADFLAAVSSEFGVVIIDKADLPEVHQQGNQLHAGAGTARARFMWGDASTMRAYALSALAIAEHLEANPPVDKEMVAAFETALIEAEMDHPDGPVPNLIARRLTQAGYRITKETR